MTVRELLELAAKAAGNVERVSDGFVQYEELNNGLRISLKAWDPITDDGDALRLAVKLVIDLDQYVGSIRCIKSADFDGAEDIAEVWEDFGDDPYAAARRAIVRAAAAIAQAAQ